MQMKCTCKHAFQDAQYGQGVRLHNIGKMGKEARCTVCGKATKLKD